MWHTANLSLNDALFRTDPHATSTAEWRLTTFPYDMPACVTPGGTSPSPKRSYLLQSISCVFSTGGVLSVRLRNANLGAAHLGRWGIDRRPVGREPRPRARPVARATRSQSRKNRVRFAKRPAASAVPSRRGETYSATESSSKIKGSTDPIHLAYEIKIAV